MRTISCFALLFMSWVAALAFELPPYVYKDMQKKAPEFVFIRVTEVKTKTVAIEDGIRTDVTVKATVDRVVRSKSRLKPKAAIVITYQHMEYSVPVSGPSPVPILKRGMALPAYLGRAGNNSFVPAAGGFTFETVK